MPDTKRTASGVLGGIAGMLGLSVVAGVLITATVTPAIAVSGAAASSAITMFDNLPSILDIEDLMLPSTMYYTDPATGSPVELATFYDQNRSPVTFEQIAPVMYDAILSSEDPRYYQHGGIDLIGTSRALLQNLRGGGETQGGSSISQQYVKNILIQRCESDATSDEELQKCFTDATNSSGTEGIQRKLQEMRYSIALEQKYSKNEILLGYLNIANFGGTTYGIDAAARYYFGVTAADLNLAQAATLAGIVQNPNTYRIDKTGGSITDAAGVTYNKAPDGSIDDVNPNTIAGLKTLLDNGTITQEQYLAAADGYSATKGRQLYVLSRLLDDGKITQEQYTEAVIAPITPNINPSQTGCVAAGGAAYFCQYVKSIIKTDAAFGATQDERDKTLQRGGLKIYTTLDVRLQAAAEGAMNEYVPTSVANMKFGSTNVNIEASTGRILSIAQNTRFSETADAAADPNLSSLVYAGDVTHGGSSGFSAGSTFKIFTLIDWLEKGHSVNERLDGRVRVIDKMKDSCAPDGAGYWYNGNDEKIGNFGGGGGNYGTPMDFTASSLNSGYFAMAEELDLCDIQKVATKMGVMKGTGGEVAMHTQFSVIGDSNIAPIAMAGAYATVANNGTYCQPKVIDRVLDRNDAELAIPATTCTQVIDPKVAATAAYALQGVMNRGGTGANGNPYDGTPLLGKTGTHEQLQTWLVESSTKVTNVTWVGNSEGEADVFKKYYNGNALSNLRYLVGKSVQRTVDEVYGGDDFPEPDNSLTRRVLKNLPNVVGLSVDEATSRLDDAGFTVSVGTPVDSTTGAGLIAQQDPAGGQAVGGTTVTISPSTGQGVSIPDVNGQSLEAATSSLKSVFGNVTVGTCTADGSLDANRKTANGTNPAAGTMTNSGAAVSINYTSKTCP
ncbi:transglycosylase domain-containing protein [Microbacterium sp. P03]|uniref:transglycosylase domain-containing protein n=1 Tax=Microbacterium sp. P03 TaxID=3366946 RepID=UPI0037473B2B